MNAGHDPCNGDRDVPEPRQRPSVLARHNPSSNHAMLSQAEKALSPAGRPLVRYNHCNQVY
jgi:hypothetical protein